MLKYSIKLYYDRRSVGQSVLVSGTPLGPATNFSSFLDLFLDSYWSNDVGRLLWREVGSVVLSWAHFIDSIFETPPTWRVMFLYFPQEQGSPVVCCLSNIHFIAWCMAYVIMDLIRALWRVNLLLVFNWSPLNKEYNLINVLWAFVVTISMCNLHVIVVSKITTRYFILFTKLLLCPFNERRALGGLIRWEK
jgi:hypothetical protein